MDISKEAFIEANMGMQFTEEEWKKEVITDDMIKELYARIENALI